MATLADIKAALSFPPDPDNAFITDGRTIDNPEVARIQAWFEAVYAGALGGRSATANDFAAWLWRHIAGEVRRFERRRAEAALPGPEELG